MRRSDLLVASTGKVAGAEVLWRSSLPADDQASPGRDSFVRPAADALVALAMNEPGPVQGADWRTHLLYELLLINMATDPIELLSVEILDRASGAPLGTLDKKALAPVLRLNGGVKGSALPVGGSAILFMDVTYGTDGVTPQGLKHRFTVEVNGTAGQEQAATADRDPVPAAPRKLSFVGAALGIARPAVVVAPPLRGAREPDPRTKPPANQGSEPFATSVGGAVKLCGGSVGRSSIYKAMQRGELRYRKCGARRVILIAELHEWLQNLPSPAASMRHG